MQRTHLTWSLSLAILAACGSEDEEAANADAGTDSGASDSGSTSDARAPTEAGPGDAAIAEIEGNVGNFSVRVVQPSAGSAGHVSVTGKVYDGLVPPDLLWAEDSSAGDCALLKPRAPFCEGGCGAGKCVEDDVCQVYPEARDVGVVTLSGVETSAGASSAKLTAILGSYGPASGVSFVYPGVAEGGAVSIAAEGKSVAAFTVAAKGVTPLVLTSTNFRLDPAAPFVLTWDRAGAASDAKIRVRLDISHHGGARGLITCQTDDTGTVEIAASLVKGLIDLGVAGFPTVVVARESIGSTDIGAGSVSLTVYSDVEHAVEIDGLVSCGGEGPEGDADCPSGQTCRNDLTCK